MGDQEVGGGWPRENIVEHVRLDKMGLDKTGRSRQVEVPAPAFLDCVPALRGPFGQPAPGKGDIFGHFIHQGIINRARQDAPAQKAPKHGADARADFHDM